MTPWLISVVFGLLFWVRNHYFGRRFLDTYEIVDHDI